MKLLLEWYKKNRRDLPWRNTYNPYLIWISEIILQQTRVKQGIGYYQKFVERYPTINKLANAPIDDVLLLWQGLGYYSRARNMMHCARTIIDKYNGRFPEEFNELKKLKGIGDYTAAAIASIAFNKATPAVDGNIFRVLSRYYEISEPIDTSKGRKLVFSIADKLLNKKNPGMHNQAIMELGAIICLPKNPLCDECPVSYACLSYKNNSQREYPVKRNKVKVQVKYLYFVIINMRGLTFILKRNGKGIWQGLYQFPVYESHKEIPEGHYQGVMSQIGISDMDGLVVKKISKEITHKLSHRTLKARFIHIEPAPTDKILFNKYLKVPIKDISSFALPRLITRYLEDTPL